MNNIQFWIWLIVIVVTFIARARKKKQPVETTKVPTLPRHPVDQENSKPMTFEELLREIEAAKAPYVKPVSQPVKQWEETDARSLERTTNYYPQPERTNEVYEKAKQEAFYRPSLEETLSLKDTIVRFGQFKGYQHEEKISPAAALAKEIRNPSGFKKAFIMSEILNRRF